MQVSIVVNVYNEENNIAEFLDSLVELTFKDFELIVVDDGSTDSTMTIIDRYRDKLDIRTISLDHVGLRNARNKGVRSSDKEIVITLDADEIIDKHCIERLVESFKDVKVGAVGGFTDVYGSNWLSRGRRTLNKMVFLLEKKRSRIKRAYGGCSAYRRKVIEELGGLRIDNVVGDTDIAIKMHEAGFIVMLRDDAVVYHKEPESLLATMQRELKQGQNSLNFYLEYKKRLLQWQVLSRFYPLIFLPLLFFNWKLTFLGLFSTFLATIFLFKDTKASISDKIYGWVVLTYTNFWWGLGFLIGLIRKVRAI